MIKRAYSLTEMAIVVLIVSILATGALSVYFNLDSGIRAGENERKLDVIYKAIGRYVQENGRLPCPAPINVARRLAASTSFGASSGSAGSCSGSGVYLNSTVSGNCATTTGNLVYGMLPVQDLDLDLDYALDAYENKFTYIVDQRFTSSANSGGFGSIYPATSIMTVNDKGGSTTHTITNDAVFVIISHGRNGYGAYMENLISASSGPSDSDENENYGITCRNDTDNKADFDNTFINKSLDNETFDDTLFFKTRDQIVVDFRAYNKVYCLGSDGDEAIYYNNTTPTFTWPTYIYNSFVQSDVSCPDTSGSGGENWTQKSAKPLKRCGVLGKWDSGVTVACSNTP